MENQTRTLAIDVTLTEKQIESIDRAIPQDLTVTRKLGGVATNLLTELAGGGSMLSPSDMQRIAKAAGGVPTPEGVVKLAEKGCDRDGDHLYGTWKIDPAFEGYFRESAASIGRPVEKVIQDTLDDIFRQVLGGWLKTDAVHQILLSTADKRKIGAAIGKEEFTGGDILQYIESLTESPVIG
jgi:hypothetical protein